MEFHKPKPVHSWREFLTEVGTIVLGILIALSLEQMVETWHEHRQYLLGEILGFLVSARPMQPLGVERHEAGAERAFAEQPPEGVGEPEGDEEGVGLPTCAHHPAHQHFASKARDSADHGQPADGAGGLVKVHLGGAAALQVRRRSACRPGRGPRRLRRLRLPGPPGPGPCKPLRSRSGRAAAAGSRRLTPLRR